jgi:hypothetical protein
MPWERIGFYVTCLILPVPLVFLASSVTSHLGQSDRRIRRKSSAATDLLAAIARR